MLNHLLLISCICIVIALILYFFHWNRFIGFLMGWGIRLMYWNEEASSIWVEIGSIHFSLISGRILLKDVRYHSSNQTIKIVKGQIQWRYWIRRPTSEEEIGTLLCGEDQRPPIRSMHCRIQVSFQGFEWFLYNRTAAYENIIAQMEANSSSRPDSRTNLRRQSFQKSSRAASSSPFYPPSIARGTLPIPRGARKAAAWIRRQLPNLDPKDLLPLGIEVMKGVVICGNSSTPNLLIAEFQRAEGTFGIVKSRSKFDLYKQVLNLKFQHALVRLIRNGDYAGPMSNMGELVHDRVIQYSTLSRASSYLSFRPFIKLWNQLGLAALTQKFISDRREHAKLPSAPRPPKKSAKSTDDVTPIGADFSILEYAIQRKILEAPILELSYYTDVPGEVPPLTEEVERRGIETLDIGNGDISPEWGFDLVVHGGFLRYGPWADRQRVELQRAFFPPTYQDGQETQFLRPGDTRVWAAMKVFIELRDDTTLHVPFREASKDWQWDGKGGITQRRRIREPAAIHLTVGDRSSINYTMPMVAGPDGYQPVLEVHLDTVVVTSSLNDIRLVAAESCRIHAELPTPLKWNLERKWIVTTSLRQPVLYLIRDHINMFIDLGRDWTAGPPTDYQRFIPMVYSIQMEMHHFELNMYANDHNIIDKPLIRDENALLTTRGAYFNTKVEIPSNVYQPESSNIVFLVEAPDASMSLSLPRWNTNALHAPKLGNSLAKLGFLQIQGSYRYFAEVRKEHVEQLKLNFKARDVAFKELGWSIRYFMVMRDNYLGSFTHFTTLYEYLDKKRQNLPLGDPIISKYRENKSNALQAEVLVSIEHAIIILPAGLPGYEITGSTEDGIGACVIMTIPEIQLQFRMHDYYMEMSLNVDTISGGILPDYPEVVTYSKAYFSKMQEILVLDGVDITANRLFGPQPRTATYVCIWEINLGHIKALLSASEGRILAAAGNAFRLNYADFPNAPASEFLPAIDPDVTFVKFVLTGIDFTWQAGHAALVLSVPLGIKVNTNDLGGIYHRKAISLQIPEMITRVLLTASMERNRWLEAAEIVAGAHMDIYAAPHNYRDMTKAQRTYVEAQDQLTGRARQMFRSLNQTGLEFPAGSKLHMNGLFLPHPALPRLHDHKISSTHVAPVTDQLARSWPLPKLTQLSESDGEEGISEADRDARLARTRSSTPLPHYINEDDQNMTSGDESDNEDLTDASSDSDWSDLAYSSDTEHDHSLLLHYAHVTRQYIASHLGSPDLWNGTPFILIKDRAPLGLSSMETDKNSDDYPMDIPAALKTHMNLTQGRNVTSYRFRCHKAIEVRITPLILPAVIQLEEDMREDPFGPELCVDSMMASYLSGISPSDGVESCILFEAAVPSVVLHVLQRIVMTDGHPTISRDFSEADNPSGLDVIAVAQNRVEGIVANGVIRGKTVAVKAGCRQFSLTLDMSVDKRTIQPASSNKFVFSYALEDFNVDFIQDNLAVSWGENTMHIGHLGPEYVTATCIALARNTKELVAVGQRWHQYSTTLPQNIVCDVLRLSCNKPIIDPLSTIQPSYLVQTGIPNELRTDTTFRFLFHLRNCLWHLDPEERETFSSIRHCIASIDLEELTSLLDSRLAALDPDAYNIAHWSSLFSLFPNLEFHDTGDRKSSSHLSPNAISVRFLKISIIVLDPSCTSHSEFALTNVHFNARIRPLEVLQILPIHPMSMSQTSLKDRRTQRLLKTTMSMVLGDITLTIFPHLLHFAQLALRVRRYYHMASKPNDLPTSSSFSSDILGNFTRSSSSDVTFTLRRLQIQAGAENLLFEFGVSGIHGASSFLLWVQGQRRQSMSHSILFDEVYLRARSPVDMAKQSDQDILASLDVVNGKLNLISRQGAPSEPIIRSVFVLGGIKLSVPRSALRLYRFVEEWRADFLPGIEATVQALLSELHRAPTKPSSTPISQGASIKKTIQVQGQLSYFGISLQVMHGTWLSWEADTTTSYFDSSITSTTGACTFGVQIASITLSISSKPNASDVPPSTRVKLVLPQLSITGHHDGTLVHTLALVEFIELKVKPSHWDTLLVVQQKFGQDFNDLVTLIQETRRRTPQTQKPLKIQTSRLGYRGFLKIRGFRVGLEGLSSTVYLECLDIGGGIHNEAGLAWNVGLSDLAFSLAPRTINDPHYHGFNRKHRSAFVIIDFKVSAENKVIHGSLNTVVQISVTKMHAVMQPSSIGEVGDFIDHLQAEMLDRQEQRALELAAFKEKTQSILKTFDDGIGTTKIEEKSSWLDNFIINVSTRNIGVAFPLTHDHDLELPQTGNRDSSAVRAFLFSIRSIEFSTHRGETGQAIMKSFSFQFVSRFRQSVSSDFSGESHQTRNRLIYPEMEAQLRSTHSSSSRHVWIEANVSGFILDLDSNIPSYVFSLIDVYRQGKDRVEKLSTSAPRTPIGIESSTEKEQSLEKQYNSLLTSNVLASLTFFSGKVRVYSGSASNLYRTRSFSHKHHEPSDEQVMDLGAEVFNLPVVSVWAEYRATPASRKLGVSQESEPSILMFKSTVHSSQNTLRPTLLPFLTELVSHIEARLRKISLQTPYPINPTLPDTPPAITLPNTDGIDSVSSMRISFSLRIDQSKLELTCQPDVNVIAGLHWDSGGFIVNVSPGAREVTFTGSVGGLTLGLKHGFLSEDCVKLDARNLAFSVTFAKIGSSGGPSVSSVSVVLDTEFLGIVRFSRLQDVLCFKAVWLDRIPIFNSQSAVVGKPHSPSSSNFQTESPKHEFTVVILVRIRQITLEIDLGQSISVVTLDLNEAVLRTKLTQAFNEVSVFVAKLAINAKGNIAGHAHVPKCVFQTIRSTEGSPLNSDGKSRMLELRMTSGPLIVSLESDHQRLLHYRAEPLEVEILDDWSAISHQGHAEERPLRLSFTVMSPEIVVVATVGTIPKLLTYANKFTSNMDAQRLGASKESKTFRVTRSPKPENPLSAVAEAMLHSARSRFKEADSGLMYVITQHMSLRLDLLRLVVFPRTMDDLEIAQFIGRDIRARLDRLVESESTPGKKDLHLSFSSMSTSKFTGLGHPPTADLLDGREWLAGLLRHASEAIIVGLPSMMMHMVSEEQVVDTATNLIYDFHSRFVRREGMRDFENIYITLNVSLYSWLTILRKNLTREMDQVKATTDWRTLLNTVTSNSTNGRKRPPEPLLLVDSPRSATTPSLGPKVFSPFSPTTALRSSMAENSSGYQSFPSTPRDLSPGPQAFPSIETQVGKPTKRTGINYVHRDRHIERLTMRQLGEATPDVMHPFFMKKAGFNLEDSLPQYVNEYATAPLEEIMEILLKLYSRQLLTGNRST